MTQSPFEMPKEMRELAEKNVEQAQAAYRQFSDAITQAMGMWSKAIPANDMTSGLAVVQDRTVRFAKQNADAAFELATKIAKAKDIQEILSLQSSYAQSQVQSYVMQTQEMGRIMSDAMQSMKPRI